MTFLPITLIHQVPGEILGSATKAKPKEAVITEDVIKDAARALESDLSEHRASVQIEGKGKDTKLLVTLDQDEDLIVPLIMIGPNGKVTPFIEFLMIDQISDDMVAAHFAPDKQQEPGKLSFSLEIGSPSEWTDWKIKSPREQGESLAKVKK